MVHSFFIHTVLPGDIIHLYSYDFTPFQSQVSDNTVTSESADHIRSRSKTLIREIAEEVQSQYAFQSSVSGKSYEEDLQKLTNESAIPNLELGYIRLKNCVSCECDIELTDVEGDKIVLWMAALNCAFGVILDPLENRMNAESVLKLVISQLHQKCQVFLKPNEISSKLEMIDFVVLQFIPNGTLLFMNHRTVRQFEKELDHKFKNTPMMVP